VHDCLAGLPSWQEHEARVLELEDLAQRWASHDLAMRRKREEQLREYQAAVDAAVAEGREPPEAPPVVQAHSRSADVHLERTRMHEEGRRLMDQLRPLVVRRAQAREQELLALARERPLAELPAVRDELSVMCETLRHVLLDNSQHRMTVEAGEVAEAALQEGTSVLFLPAAGPTVQVLDTRRQPAGVVMVDHDRGPSQAEALAARRRAETREIKAANVITHLE
jgi:hypothetical protein